jgi:transcriptional regulator with XRE-family HTH domain
MNGALASLMGSARKKQGLTQSELAREAGIDQSRVSRIENGGEPSPQEFEAILAALQGLGDTRAAELRAFMRLSWQHIEAPSFENPEREVLVRAEEVLASVETFLADQSRPWPLRRQLEKHRGLLASSAAYLSGLDHRVAFIGDIGVGKSTAISYLFDLLVPEQKGRGLADRAILETGAGGTTVCEVHIKDGPEYGISIVPMPEAEMSDLVRDFCASRWLSLTGADKDGDDTVNVSQEIERAIRNMSGLTRTRKRIEGKLETTDPLKALAEQFSSEDAFRASVYERLKLPARTKRALWRNPGSDPAPEQWLRDTFRAVNNGRVAEMALPKSIDLMIPRFSEQFGPFNVTVVDTKGVDDIAVREDLDLRLRDARTVSVFCSRFNDAPGTTTKLLLDHIGMTRSTDVESGKLSLLVLPRSGEARAMKDDSGEQALSDEEGCDLKEMQIDAALAGNAAGTIPVAFFNVEVDRRTEIAQRIADQIRAMRAQMARRLGDLCSATLEIVNDHEAQARAAAVEAAAEALRRFLDGNRALGAREQHAYRAVIDTIQETRYASTIWASCRRNGDYSGLNALHLLGVGAQSDAKRRSAAWANALEGQIKALLSDAELDAAHSSIKQIARAAGEARGDFLSAVRELGREVYREELEQAPAWRTCAAQWGQGPGFKGRVVKHLTEWFEGRTDLKERLEELIVAAWEREVIRAISDLVAADDPWKSAA